ncbi:MAG: surface carbohydrate biosynthesis protein [Devosia sp.]
MSTTSLAGARIGLIVDHPKRDLDGAVLLAYQLARRGAEAIIIPMYTQAVDIPLLGLDAVVSNYCRPANLALLSAYAKAGTAIFVLDTEGGVLADKGGNSPPAMAQAFVDNGFGAVVSGYFFWGPLLRDAFDAIDALPTAALQTTGCPRFDFAAERWRPLLDREQAGYILVNANFPLVNPRFSKSPIQERNAMVASGWDANYVDTLISDMIVVFANYLQTIHDVAAARPDLQFLVRPHPFEAEMPYRDKLAGLANVRVDGRGGVLPVIANCQAILHLNCGTAIEAVMLGKLPVQMEFLNTAATAGHARLPAQVSYTVGSLSALLQILNALPRATQAFDFDGKHADHIRPFFSHNDGLASTRVAEALLSWLQDRRIGVVRRSLLDSLTGMRQRPTPSQWAQGALSLVLGSFRTSALRARHSKARRDKAIALKPVQSQLARIAVQDGRGHSVTARRLGGPLGAPLSSIMITASTIQP